MPAALPSDHDDDGLRVDRGPAGSRRDRGGRGAKQADGIAVVGGLLVSQWLTLYATPVVYLFLDRLNTWMSRPRLLSWPWARRPV
jgi:hypothetical protein